MTTKLTSLAIDGRAAYAPSIFRSVSARDDRR